jgi:tRNA A-37 threonylcarbamoyl transferase component Bud32
VGRIMRDARSIIKLYNAGIPLHSIARIKRVHIHTVIDIVYQLNVKQILKRRNNEIADTTKKSGKN